MLSACRSSTCMDLRPGLVVFLFLAGRAVAQIELDWTDWLNATWIMGGGNSRRAHPDKKFTTRSPPHANFPPLPSVFLNHFSFFFFQRTHWPAERHKSYCGHTVGIYTERPACKDEAESLAHRMNGWSVVTRDGWQAPSAGKQTHGYVDINKNDKQTSIDILMVIFKAHTDRWRHYCKQSPITICDNLQSKPHLG